MAFLALPEVMESVRLLTSACSGGASDDRELLHAHSDDKFAHLIQSGEADRTPAFLPQCAERILNIANRKMEHAPHYLVLVCRRLSSCEAVQGHPPAS